MMNYVCDVNVCDDYVSMWCIYVMYVKRWYRYVCDDVSEWMYMYVLIIYYYDEWYDNDNHNTNWNVMSKSKGREQCPCSDDDVMSRGIITCDNNEDDDE